MVGDAEWCLDRQAVGSEHVRHAVDLRRARHAVDPEHVGQEGDDLVRPGAHHAGAFVPWIAFVEHPLVILGNRRAAGPGGNDDVVVALERPDRPAREPLRRLAVTPVPRRLPATGLRRRHLDGAAGLFEEPDRSEADLRPDEIDKAGDEERDPRTCHGAPHRDEDENNRIDLLAGQGRHDPEVRLSAPCFPREHPPGIR